MTLRSLYRLERRRLLDVPVIGVAVGRLATISFASTPARRSPQTGEQVDEEVFDRFAAPPELCERRLRRRADVQAARPGALVGDRPGLLPRDPAVAVRDRGRGPGAGAAWSRNGQRVVVEKPFGHDLASARDARGRPAPVPRRVPALPDRPLPRQDGRSRRSLYLRFANTMLEPVWNRNHVAQRTDHDGRARSGSRIAAASTTRSARCATWSSTTCSRCSRRPRWSRPAAGDAETLKDAKVRRVPVDGRRRPHALRPRPVRRLPATIDGVAPDSTTETYRRAAARDRQLALGRRAVLHPHRQAPPGQRRPRCGSSSGARRGCRFIPGATAAPAPNQIVFRIDPSTGIRIEPRRAPGRPSPARARSTSTCEFAHEGGEDPTPYEVLLNAALVGDSTHFTRQDMVEETLADRAAAARLAAAGPSVRAGVVGARGGGRTVAKGSATGTDRGCRRRTEPASLKQQVDRLLEQLADAREELSRRRAVQDPVIARERRAHADARRHDAVTHDGHLPYLADGEDRGLR